MLHRDWRRCSKVARRQRQLGRCWLGRLLFWSMGLLLMSLLLWLAVPVLPAGVWFVGSRQAPRRRTRRVSASDIALINSSGKPQLEDALALLASAGGPGSADPPVLALLGQEHHCRKHGWVDLQHRAKQGGWQVVGAEAVAGEGGRGTAGALVAAPNRVGMDRLPGRSWDVSPDASPGRLAAAWVDTILHGGLLLMSAYFWVSEG